jgi:ATP-dependent DNA ligase
LNWQPTACIHISNDEHLPPGFIIPAQPVPAVKSPSGPPWVHEIKHDGYRLIVRWDSSKVRLYTRNATDLTARLSGIATAATSIEATTWRLIASTISSSRGAKALFQRLQLQRF